MTTHFAAGNPVIKTIKITTYYGFGRNLIFIQANFCRAGFGQRSGVALSSGGLVYDDAFAIANEIKGVKAVVVEQNSS